MGQFHEPPGPLLYTVHSDFQTALTITHSEKHFTFDPVHACLRTPAWNKSFMRQYLRFLSIIHSDSFLFVHGVHDLLNWFHDPSWVTIQLKNTFRGIQENSSLSGAAMRCKGQGQQGIEVTESRLRKQAGKTGYRGSQVSYVNTRSPS